MIKLGLMAVLTLVLILMTTAFKIWDMGYVIELWWCEHGAGALL